MNARTYHVAVGAFDMLLVKDGSGGSRPLADLVEIIPADLVGRDIFMEGGLMVVDLPNRRLLIDTGNGPARGPRTHTAEAAFAAQGIRPESIDWILLTHGDPDHVAGLLDERGDLIYPRAEIVLSTELWNAFHSDPGAGLYFPGQEAFFRRLLSQIENRSIRFEGECEIAPGIRAVPAPGHRVGHTAYRFESDGQILYHLGDAAFDPLFLERPELVIGQEFRPTEASASRLALAHRTSRDAAWVVGSHFDVANVGKLRESSRAGWFVWEPHAR